MDRVSVQDFQIIILAPGESPSAIGNAVGKLFEKFIAQVMHEFGFNEPTTRDLNVTSDGIELDVVLRSSFTKNIAFAEGKAYATNVKAQALTSFYGKLGVERFEEADAHGYLFTIPRLTAEGDEKARTISARDQRFHYFDAHAIVGLLTERGIVRRGRTVLPEQVITSDETLIITSDGLYSCAKVLDPLTRRAVYIPVWGKNPGQQVPVSVIGMLAKSDYAGDLPVRDVEHQTLVDRAGTGHSIDSPVIVTVRGSSSDF